MKNRVKELRVEKDISQLCLAMNVGCAQNTISKIELGTTEPKASLLIAISKYFNVSVDYILYNSELKRTHEKHYKAIRTERKYSKFFENFEYLNDTNKETVSMLAERLVNVQAENSKEG